MEEEEFTCVCPKCSCTIGFDDAGDAYIIEEEELPRGATRTHKGLVVVDADPNWREKDYLRNQQANHAPNTLIPPTSFQKIVEELEPPTEPEPIEPSPEVLAAVDKDLRDRGVI